MQTKFFKLTTLALFVGALFVSCGDDDKEPAKVPVEIVPVFPAEGSTIDMEDEAYYLTGIEFKWESFEGVTSYIIEVSDKSDFSNVLANISGNQLSYLWPASEIDAKLKALEVAYESTLTLYWRVQAVNPEDFSESTYKTSSFTIKRRVNPGLSGEWLFDTEDFVKAQKGAPLEKCWAKNSSDVTEDNQFDLVDGPKEGDRAVRLYSNGWFICRHGLTPAVGDQYVSRYTLLFDVKFVTGDTYMMMSCTNLCWWGFGSHGSARPDGCIGGYGDNILQGFSFENLHKPGSQQISLSNATWLTSRDPDRTWVPVQNEWYRVVLTVDLKQNPIIADVWIDGVRRLWPLDTQLGKFTDDMANTRINWLPEGVVLFPQMGQGNMLGSADFARVAIWDYALSEDEIVTLGVAGDPTAIGQ